MLTLQQSDQQFTGEHILEEQLQSLLHNPRVTGTYIWQFCDVNVSEENSWVMRRPKGQNNKGVVDLYRRPKLSYNTVKAAYTAKADTIEE